MPFYNRYIFNSWNGFRWIVWKLLAGNVASDYVLLLFLLKKCSLLISFSFWIAWISTRCCRLLRSSFLWDWRNGVQGAELGSVQNDGSFSVIICSETNINRGLPYPVEELQNADEGVYLIYRGEFDRQIMIRHSQKHCSCITLMVDRTAKVVVSRRSRRIIIPKTWSSSYIRQ